MNTQELRDVLKKNTDLNYVTLPKAKDCTAFWTILTCDVFSILTSEQEDYKVKCSMRTFANVDSLEVVNKQGKILKRFAKHYKEENGTKLPDSVLGVIGDKLQYLLTNDVREYWIDFTDEFDWRDGQFGKDGSCWWGTYSASLPTFQNGGGWAIRFYKDDNKSDYNGIGRTWILPKDGILMCFNAYGIERPQVSKVIKTIFAKEGIELHYKAVEIENSNHSEIPYINSGTGFILYPEGYTDIQDSYDVDMEVEDDDSTTCEGCGCRIDEDDRFYVNDYDWCESCYNDRFSSCDKCGETYDRDEVHQLSGSPRYDYVCEYCAEKIGAEKCSECEDYFVNFITTDEGNVYCEDCNSLQLCETCDEYHESDCPNEESGDETSEETSEETVPDEVIEHDFISQNLETVSFMTGDGQKTVTGTVYRHDNIPGLYMLQRDNGWAITHESSGLAIKAGIPESYKAFELLSRLDITDWNRSQESITNDRYLCENIMNIREALGLR